MGVALRVDGGRGGGQSCLGWSMEIFARLQSEGFVVVPGLLSRSVVVSARKNLTRYYPAPAELRATPERYAELLAEIDNLKHEFPFAGDALNDLATDPKIARIVTELLGTDDIRLSQAAIWAKYAGFGSDYEQELHADFEGNTLVIPRDDGDFRQVNLILYLTDVTADLGPTRLVPLKHTRSNPLWPPWRPRDRYPALYKHERPVLARAGDVLVFGMSVFHRASPITATEGCRLTLHLVYRAGRHGFQGYQLWSKQGEDPHLSRFLQRATVEQRSLLGFPKPGDAYWNAETLQAVALRYPRMDLAAYRI